MATLNMHTLKLYAACCKINSCKLMSFCDLWFAVFSMSVKSGVGQCLSKVVFLKLIGK